MTYRLQQPRHHQPKLIRTVLASLAALTGAATLALPSVGLALGSLTTVTPDPNVPVVISEVLTGGCDNTAPPCSPVAKQEFVELYNQTEASLTMHGWRLEYLSSAGEDSNAILLATLDGSLAGHSYMLLGHSGYYGDIADGSFGSPNSGSLAEAGGHIRLLDDQGSVVDLVGWGTAAKPLTAAAPAAKQGFSLQRLTAATSSSQLQDSRNNLMDFAQTNAPTPQGGGYTAGVPAPAPSPPPTTPPDGEPPTSEPPAAPALTCEGAIISELLPNPAGSDSGHEFIELRNPTTEAIDLDGCNLQTSANSKTFELTGISLQPGEYRSFGDSQTGLTLSNASGGTVWLTSPAEELQAITYPGDLPDDTAWALTDGSWGRTYTPTPGNPNLLTASAPCPAGEKRNPETNRCVAAETAEDSDDGSLVPCKAGQERNPETNRCRAIASTAASLAACRPGQERNPATNRCAAAAAAATALACKPGQQRNPETNRCRAIPASSAATKTCPAGQERNPETNRCRKSGAASATSTDKVQDIESPANLSDSRWLLAALLIAGAIGYGIYEWRQEIRLKLQDLYSRLTGRHKLQSA